MCNFASLLEKREYMVNRELIRLKTVQIVYSYYVNGSDKLGEKGISTSEKELFFSLDKAYELYHGMLALLLEIRRVAIEDFEQKKLRNRQLGKNEVVDNRFVNNRLLQIISENEQLREFREKNNQFWIEDEAMARNIFNQFTQTSDYETYLKGEDNFENDAEAIRRLYRTCICNNDEVTAALEDKCIYWNDDKYIIDTFILKTLRLFKEDADPNMPLLPQYERNEDKEFALQLFHYAIENGEYYRSLIEENAVNWDMRRIATMDIVIVQTGLAEICSFPTIPVAVSINEYINIAKVYSAQRNWGYVNATLDKIAKQLLAEGKIEKK